MSEPDTVQIRIDFPTPVRVSREAHAMLVAAIDQVCRDWEAENLDQVMWVSGMGALMTCNPFLVDDDHPMTFDASVEHLEVTAREGYPHELKRRQEQRARELRGPLIVAGPKLLAFARSILSGFQHGRLAVAAADDVEAAAHLGKVLARGEIAIAIAEGRAS